MDNLININETVPVARLTDLVLFDEYQYFDFDFSVAARYAVLHNELIDRGLLVAHYVKANDFNSDFPHE